MMKESWLISDFSSEIKRPFIVVNGMHTAGKTTSLEYLSSLGYLGHAEIGWAFRQSIAYQNPGARTLQGDDLEWFDTAILEMELARDQFIQGIPYLPHCVETWHIGNLAYASQRSPHLVSKFETVFLAQTAKMGPAFIFLVIDRPTFMARCTMDDMDKDDLYTFYTRIRDVTIGYLEQHRLKHYVVENNDSLEDLKHSLEAIVRQELRP
jgi:hypothetical protein